MKVPKIKKLKKGIIRCDSCGKKINFTEFEPLEIIDCPYCGMQNIVPYKIKSYWLYHPLGAGGMGSVYRAVDEETGKEFAVKILPRNKKEDKELIESLMKEGEIGASFGEHPHLISVVEYGEADGEYFMATEFVYGSRLDVLLQSSGEYIDDSTGKTLGHLSERQALDIALQIIDAEMHIINCGYLFRDLKPENVMVEENGNVKLFDYGLCMPLEEAASEENVSDTFEGSPFYIPPERIVGAPEGEYSEIYSLGMLIYYMITGRTYYSEAELQDLVVKHVKSIRIKSVDTRLKHCSPEIAKIIDAMIQRMPDDRIPDFELLKSYIQPVYDNIKHDTSHDIPLTSSSESKTEKKDDIQGMSLTTKIAVAIFSIILIGAAAVIPYYYSKYQEYQTKKKELLTRYSIELGVPENVQPPDIPEETIKELIKKRTQDIIKNRIAKLPLFDEDKVKKSVYRMFGISPKSIKTPEMSLQYYKEHFKEHIDKQIIKEVGKNIYDITLFLPFEQKKPKYKKNLSYSLDDLKLAEKMITPDMKQRAVKKIHKYLKISEPYREPDISSPEKARRLYKESLIKMVKKKFSSAELSKKIMRITKKYRSYKKGEIISVTDDSGAEVKGRYKGRAGNKILIDDREILINFIPLSSRWRFNENLSAQKITKEIHRLKKIWKIKKKEYFKKLQNQYPIEQFFAKHFYYYSPIDKQPVTAKEVVKDYLQITLRNYKQYLAGIIAKKKKKILQSVTLDKYLISAHFRKVKNQWYPAPQAVKKMLKAKKEEWKKLHNEMVKKIKTEAPVQAAKEIYPKHNYVFYNNKWQPAKTLLDNLVNKQLKSLF